jgi:hypothetical protein
MTEITPFCLDGIDCLSFDDKVNILCSTNPINTIVKIVNCQNESHHNILLKTLDSDKVLISDGHELFETDTDISLLLFVESKIIDLHKIVNEFADHLDETFLIEIRKYLNGGCNDEPNFRNNKCNPKKIFKPDVKLNKLKKHFE